MTTESQTRKLSHSLTLPLPADQEAWLKSTILDVPDYPKPGIIFKDITTLLGNGEAFKLVTDILTQKALDLKVDVIAALESRGFIFGTPVANALGIGFIPIRKPKKLPRAVERIEYELEYGKDVIEVHRDAVQPGERVLLLDDLLATGGTAAAAQQLLTKIKADVVGTGFVIELSFLEGRKRLMSGPDTFSILTY